MSGTVADERRKAWAAKTWLRPSAAVAVFLVAYVGLVLVRHGGDPLAFASLGDGFRDGQPVGELGYDGQFAYYIALDPRPARAADHLDVPAYRYQRLLYPLAAWALALGQAGLIPWTLILVNICAQVAGTYVVESWLAARGLSRWYALIYGLWAGLVLPVRLDLNEPLAYALAAAGLLAHTRGRYWISAAYLGLAVFAKETALLFVLAAAAHAVANRAAPAAVPLLALTAAPYALFQGLLYVWFGQAGLTSGGFMATPFEWIPYMGLWRIGGVSAPALAMFAVIFGPLVVLPSLWAIGASVKRLLSGDTRLHVWALAANAALLPFTPHSTVREPLGFIRLAAGLVLATLWYGAALKSKRTLNYAVFWIAALAFLRE